MAVSTTIDTPLKDSIISTSNSIKVTGKSSSTTTAVTTLVNLDGGSWINLGNVSTYSYEFKDVKNGGHTVYVKAKNRSGQVAEKSAYVVVQYDIVKTPLQVSFVTPKATDVMAGTYKITVSATPVIGVLKVEIFIDDKIVTKTNDGKTYEQYDTYDFSTDTKLYTDGTHTLKAIATARSTSAYASKIISTIATIKNSIIVASGVYDDFQDSNYSITSDGVKTPNGKWVTGYLSNGHATILTESTGNKYLELSPILDSKLHAARFDSTAAHKNIHAKMDVRLEQQNSYNTETWYTVWPLIGYVDETNHYYFNLKTNGWEIGKKDNDLDPALELQRYLVQGSTPKATKGIKAHIEYWIILGKSPVNGIECNHLVVKVDGAKIADIWDDGTHSDGKGKINPTGTKLKGAKKVALYCEASRVYWDNIVFEEATSIPA